jgi:twitching motility protein PilT
MRKEITQEQAYDYSSNTDELRELINRGVGVGSAGGRSAAPAQPVNPVLGGRNPNIKYT